MSESGTLSIAATPFGEITYFAFDNPIGAALGRYGEWAMAEIRFLRQFIAPGDTVVDGGANIGTHMMGFADACGAKGRVIAIEASPEIARLLETNVARNGLDQVRAINAALGDGEGACLIGRIDPGQPQNAGMLQASETRLPTDRTHRLAIGMVTLDSLELDALALLKLDVEGAELAALRGGLETIRRLRPTIATELLDLSTALPVIDLLAELGYKPFFCSFAAFNPDNHGGSADDMFGVAREASLLFLPDAGVVPEVTPGAYVAAVLDPDTLARLLFEMPRYGDATDHDRVHRQLVAERDALRRELDAVASPPLRSVDETRFTAELSHLWQAVKQMQEDAAPREPDHALDDLRAELTAAYRADRTLTRAQMANVEQRVTVAHEANDEERRLIETRIDLRMSGLEAQLAEKLAEHQAAIDEARGITTRLMQTLRADLDEVIARVKGDVTSLRQILIGRGEDKGRLAMGIEALGKRLTAEIEAVTGRIEAEIGARKDSGTQDRLRAADEALGALHGETEALRETMTRLEGRIAAMAEERPAALNGGGPVNGFFRRATDLGHR